MSWVSESIEGVGGAGTMSVSGVSVDLDNFMHLLGFSWYFQGILVFCCRFYQWDRPSYRIFAMLKAISPGDFVELADLPAHAGGYCGS